MCLRLGAYQGCASSRRVTEAGQLSVTSAPASPIGDVQPVYISIANGTDTPRAIVPTQIFALNDDGNRVAPLPPGEAARQAGGPGELKSALTSAAATGAVQGRCRRRSRRYCGLVPWRRRDRRCVGRRYRCGDRR